MARQATTKVSIIVTARNYGRYLAQCIDSALRQNHSCFEVVVVNDGSTDTTADVLRSYEDKIKIVTLTGVGLARACNAGIHASTGEYVIRLDADDYFDENILLIESNILDTRPDIHLVYPDYYRVSQDGSILEQVRLPRLNDEVKLLDRSPLAAGAMFRRSCFDEIGGYSEELRYQEDYDFWIRFIEKFNVYNVNLPLLYYRKHDLSMSTNVSSRMDARRYVKQKFVEERGYRGKKKIMGFIPATGLSRGNMKLATRSLAGKSVFAYTVEEALKVKLFEYLVVSSEDEEILRLARELGVQLAVKRPSELVRPEVPMEQVVRHMLETVRTQVSCEPDIVTMLHIVCPFKKEKHITEAIDTQLIYGTDSVISVTQDLTFHWKQGEYGLEMVGYNRRLLREDKETIYKENGAIYSFRAANVYTNGSLLGKKISHIEMLPHEALRLETEYDFWIAKQMVKNGKESF